MLIIRGVARIQYTVYNDTLLSKINDDMKMGKRPQRRQHQRQQQQQPGTTNAIEKHNIAANAQHKTAIVIQHQQVTEHYALGNSNSRAQQRRRDCTLNAKYKKKKKEKRKTRNIQTNKMCIYELTN